MKDDSANLEELEEVESELEKHSEQTDSVELKDLEAATSTNNNNNNNSTNSNTNTATPPPQSTTTKDKKDNKRDNEEKPKIKPPSCVKSTLAKFFSPIFIQCFTMTFLAEWGDRSQITTIAMAAVKDPIGVTLGGILGHSCCTGLAVMGGKLLATRISERSVAITGGVLFLIFALHSLYYGP